MRYRRHILDRGYHNSGCLNGTDRSLTPAARTFHQHLHLPQTVFSSFLGSLLCCHLGCIWRAFPRPLEPRCARAAPGDDIPLSIGHDHDSIVECGLDVSPTFAYLFSLSSSATAPSFSRHDYLLRYFFARPRLCPRPATVFRGPRLVRALVRVRCPWTGKPRRCLIPR